MPPTFASFLTVAFMAFLFRRDLRAPDHGSRALWIPTLWFFIISTRAVSEWLSMFGISVGGSSLEGGVPVDAVFYFGLIALGIRVLVQRRMSLALIIRNNPWFFAYLLFCFLAILWSDFPFVAFKRWIKGLGSPVMVLILFTEPSFEEALTRVLKRCAYVIVPVSILFIKYYPEWGRGFSEWTGQAYNNGITLGKNGLGYDCLILGFFFVWHLLVTLRQEKGKARRAELMFCLGFLAMIYWLFSIADSKTPLVSLYCALVILLFTGFRWVNKRLIGAYIVSGALLLMAAEMTFGIYEVTLQMLGRDASLTERTPLWAELRNWGAENPVLGYGYESFWLGERREKIWDIMGWNASEAHNGYLETWLNLGAVGLILLLGLIIDTYRKAGRALVQDYWFGRFRFAFFFGILLYNWTESSWGSLHPVFFIFFVIALDYPRPAVEETPSWGEPVEEEAPEPAFQPV